MPIIEGYLEDASSRVVVSLDNARARAGCFNMSVELEMSAPLEFVKALNYFGIYRALGERHYKVV